MDITLQYSTLVDIYPRCEHNFLEYLTMICKCKNFPNCWSYFTIQMSSSIYFSVFEWVLSAVHFFKSKKLPNLTQPFLCFDNLEDSSATSPTFESSASWLCREVEILFANFFQLLTKTKIHLDGWPKTAHGIRRTNDHLDWKRKELKNEKRKRIVAFSQIWSDKNRNSFIFRVDIGSTL